MFQVTMGAMVRIQIVRAAILHPTIIHQATVSPIRLMSKWCGDQNKTASILAVKNDVCLVILLLFFCVHFHCDDHFFFPKK